MAQTLQVQSQRADEAQGLEKQGLQDGPTNGAQSPFCRELRSKKFYFLQDVATEDHHILDVTSHCWCRQTMQAIGPDGERVHAGDCKSDRACFRKL